MGYGQHPDEVGSTLFSVDTPPTTVTGYDDLPDDAPRHVVPTPGNTYMIFERSSGRVITRTPSGLCVQDISEGQNSSNRWLCIEKDNYLGFQDPKSGTYIGHDGNFRMRASARNFQGWECVTTRDHPSGGYKLMVPFWSDKLRLIVVDEDGKSLVTREHGDTLWDFIKLSD
ncbi:hypothetical protein GQ53DRAFT_399459 [Thozetella sp. PMI_491]|nr:hypothetical protein GQ53DRAFT_399459 [Thozetella sp. PMI_491]